MKYSNVYFFLTQFNNTILKLNSKMKKLPELEDKFQKD